MLTVVALYYYIKIILPMFDIADAKILKTVYSQKFVLIITAVVTVLIGVYPEKLVELCRFIAYNI